MADKILAGENKVKRHSSAVRLGHWLVAISTFTLIFTGIGQMPMYKRYMIDQLFGLAWSSNYSVTIVLHYLAAIVLVFAVTFHLVYMLMKKDFSILPKKGDLKESVVIVGSMLGIGKEPENDKFLAEQRVAYAYMALSFLLIIVTGIIKILKNLPGVNLSEAVLNWSTTLHNLGTGLIIFGIVAHLAAFVFKDNRALVSSMFTGKVDLEYVKHRHVRWYRKMDNQSS